MDTETILYVVGGLLPVSAVAVSILGLRIKNFPGRLAPLIFVWFAILVGATATLAVVHARDEQNAKASELSKGSEQAVSEESR
jgi:hypothetical protein